MFKTRGFDKFQHFHVVIDQTICCDGVLFGESYNLIRRWIKTPVGFRISVIKEMNG